jgi:hypothetical protein
MPTTSAVWPRRGATVLPRSVRWPTRLPQPRQTCPPSYGVFHKSQRHPGKIPQGLKPLSFLPRSARLKSCPDTKQVYETRSYVRVNPNPRPPAAIPSPLHNSSAIGQMRTTASSSAPLLLHSEPLLPLFASKCLRGKRPRTLLSDVPTSNPGKGVLFNVYTYP